MLLEPILSIVDERNPSPPLRALSMPVISAASDLFNMVAVLREALGAERARFPQYA